MPRGGAEKNRAAWFTRKLPAGRYAAVYPRSDATITLPAGDYILKYESDGSHAFGDWNAAPPEDPAAWSITLFRKGSVPR